MKNATLLRSENVKLAIADQALTNAVAANNITAATDAMVYRALERNTAAVGYLCTLATFFS